MNRILLAMKNVLYAYAPSSFSAAVVSAAPTGTGYHLYPIPRPTCLGRKLPRTRTGLSRLVP